MALESEAPPASQLPTVIPPRHERVDPYLGATIDGRYFVERLLGEGGMGVVYLCRHTIIDKQVAMKVLRADMARNEEVVERFLNEARSASSIGNPHIIDISDFGRLPDGATYFVMEFLAGSSLAELADLGEPIDPVRVGDIGIQLADGLAAAHAAGIVHRDLKPDNIFLIPRSNGSDFVKILDFGIAKASTRASKLTQAGQVFGTPHYMSPEQAAGHEVDHRSDVYAVGVILYELVTGQLPFDADNFMAILTQHMYRKPTPPSELDGLPPLPLGLEDLIMDCLAKQPDERFQTMDELADALLAVFGELLPLQNDIRSVTEEYGTASQPGRASVSRVGRAPWSRPRSEGYGSPAGRRHSSGPRSRQRQSDGSLDRPSRERDSRNHDAGSRESVLPSESTQSRGARPGLVAGIGLSAALLSGALVWVITSRPPAAEDTGATTSTQSGAAVPKEPTPTTETSVTNPGATDAGTTEAKTTDGKTTAKVSSADPETHAIAIAVAPLAAHVFLGEEDLGGSPVMIEVGAEPVTLEARMEGYESATIVVDGRQDKVSVELQKIARPHASPAPRPQPMARPGTSPTPPPAPTPTPTRSSAGSELVDPWGD